MGRQPGSSDERFQPQSPRDQDPFDQFECPLHHQGQERCRHGPLKDQPDVVQADTGKDRLPVSSCADASVPAIQGIDDVPFLTNSSMMDVR